MPSKFTQKPSERARALREKEFHNKVLAALHKPQRHIVLRLINSPFFLWFMSVVILTVGGSYVTNYQNCSNTADSLIDSYRKLVTEIQNKETYIYDSINTSESIEDVRKALQIIPYTYYEFNGRSLFDLNREKKRIERLIDFSGVVPYTVTKENYYSGRDISLFSSVSLGSLGKNIGNEELNNLKNFAQKISVFHDKEFRFLSDISLAPNCSAHRSVLYAFRTRGTKLVLAEQTYVYLSRREAEAQ